MERGSERVTPMERGRSADLVAAVMMPASHVTVEETAVPFVPD